MNHDPIAIERASPADGDAILRLLNESGLPQVGVTDHLATALVAKLEGVIVGCAALELYPNGALLRSVAVDRSLQGRGLGRRLTDEAIGLARASDAPAVYLLTTTAEAFFSRFGFVRIAREDVPADVRESVEFTTACPASAAVMRARLAVVSIFRR